MAVESERLLSLVEELLKSSKYGTSTFEISPTVVNIKELAEEAVSIVKPRLQKFEIEVINELTDVHVVADFDKTKQIFLNVLDNAIKYSDATQIRMNVIINEREAKVFVHDDGIGIDEGVLAEWNESPKGRFFLLVTGMVTVCIFVRRLWISRAEVCGLRVVKK